MKLWKEAHQGTIEGMVKIHVAHDNDIDDLMKEAKAGLTTELHKAITQLQRCLSGVEVDSNIPTVSEIASSYVTILMMSAEFQTLRSLKACINTRPPSYVHGEPKVSEWLANDQRFDYMAVSTAIVALKDAGLLRFWRLRKRENCVRYKFLKPPADYSLEYRVFQKIADYFGVDLGLTETSILADWNCRTTRIVSRGCYSESQET